MADNKVSPRLRARHGEIAVLERLLVDVRGGRSRVLVITGEAGIGKTALLDHVIRRASECLIAHVAGVEAEMQMPFAGLHQLCSPFQNTIDRLSTPHRLALAGAFGADGDTPSELTIGMALLNLMAELAGDHALVCVVDDAQWLDQASLRTLEFMARRLQAEPIGVVFARRGKPSGFVPGFDELEVRGLDDDDAGALFDSVLPGRLDRRVRARIIAEARGNPLAITELPRAWTPAELVDGSIPSAHGSLSTRLEAGFARRLARLPSRTRLLLLTAAAESLGDPTVLWQAADRLGVDPAAAAAAVDAGLIDPGDPLKFRHPLVRSASYRTASAEDRHCVHQVLAEVTDPSVDPDRRAWHLSLATVGTSDDVALLLEQSAGRALTRGGIGAAAVLLERSVALTTDAGRRAQRGLAAAQVARDSGALERAHDLLIEVEGGPPDATRAADVAYLRAQISFDQRQFERACNQFLEAAAHFRSIDVDRAREIHLESLAAAIWVGRPDLVGPTGEIAAAARSAPRPDHPPRIVDQLLDAVALHFTAGYVEAAPSLRLALDRLLGQEVVDNEMGRWQWPSVNRVGMFIANELWDHDAAVMLAERQVRMSRETGAVVQLQFALTTLAIPELAAGQVTRVVGLLEEDRQLADATGHQVIGIVPALLESYRGRAEHAMPLIAAFRQVAAGDGETNQGLLIALPDVASAILNNGLGRHDAARDASLRVLRWGAVGYGYLAVGELAEAASRTGDPDLVREALDWIHPHTAVTKSDWCFGIYERVCALASAGDADKHYQASIEYLARTRLRVDLARSHLLYGEWLRRGGRRIQARVQLRTAVEMLTDIGAEAFADRARRELGATGETARRRNDTTTPELTAQELNIAQLAIDGFTSPQIGLQLFLSTRTVEWHIRKIYAKLGINSRRQLSGSLPQLRR